SDDIENKITLLKSVEKEEREKHSYFYKKLQEIEMKYLELEAQKEKLWERSEILKNTHENTQKDLEKAQKELRLLNQELEVKKLDNDTIYRNVTVLDEKLSSIKTERKMILCEIEKM